MQGNKFYDVLRSREIWVVLLGFVILGIKHFYPEFKLNIEEMAGLVGLTVTYIISLSKEKGNYEEWVGLLKSRKFWGFVVGMAVLIVNGFGKDLPFQISSEQLIGALTIISGYIVSIAVETKQPQMPNPVEESSQKDDILSEEDSTPTEINVG